MGDNKRKIRIRKKNNDEFEQGERIIRQLNDELDSEIEKNFSNGGKTQSQPAKRVATWEEIASERDPGYDAYYDDTRRGLRIALVACGAVLTLILAVCAGTFLALWDMGRTPQDLIAAVTGNEAGSSGEGLTFIDADGYGEDADTSLTFIDADEDADNDKDEVISMFPGPNEVFKQKVEGEKAQDDEEDKSDEDDSQEEMEEADEGESESENPSNMTVDENGNPVMVSAELSGIGQIVRAGTDEVIKISAATPSDVTNPDKEYPLPFTVVDDSYFDDALFIGDSRFYGFCMWSGISGTNFCATSFNIFNYQTFKVVQTGNGKVPIFNALPYNAFSKIYIKVGLNEMGSSEEKFEAVYAEVIARLREMEPRAIIYIHGVLPVTAAKSASGSQHNNPNILARNASLEKFAREQKCYYIDAGPVVSDESGCLRAEMTSDGIHMGSKYMGVWKQYLMEHAVVVE